MSFDSIYRLSVVMNMVDNITRPMSGAVSSTSAFVNKMDGMSAGFGNVAQAGMMMTGLGTEITSSVLKPVQATYDTKKALGELASVGVEDLTMMEEAAKDFSNTWAGTTKSEFITAAYDIKSGISSLTDEGVSKYTELAGITAVATKASTDTMTDLFATGYGIYRDFYSNLSDMEFAELFGAGISSSVKAFKTNGNEMAAAISALGQSATNAQVPFEEQLSILGMLQSTMSGSEAGTKYNAFLRSAGKGGKALGLSFMDANDQLLSMPEILSMLKGKFGDTMDAAEKMQLQEAFGDSEAVKLIDLMYNKTGDLQDNILGLYGSMGQGMGTITEMADAINSTDYSKFEILKQKMQTTAETLGNALSPKVSEYMDKISGAMDKAAAWISNNQALVGNIMQVVLIIGIILTVGGTLITTIGTLGVFITKTIGIMGSFAGGIARIPDLFTTMRIYGMYAGDALKGAFSTMKSAGATALQAVKTIGMGVVNFGKQAITTAITALPGLIAGVWSFTTALLANPLTWIVIAIVALIAALILLWKNWDSVTAFCKGLWTGFVDGIKAGIDWVKEKMQMLPEVFKVIITVLNPFVLIPKLIKENWGSITAFFKGIFDKLPEPIQNLILNIKKLFDPAWIKESGKKLITTFTDGIKAFISNPVEAIKGGLQKIRNMLPFSDAKTGPLDSLTLSGNRVLQTVSTGIKQSEDLPAQAVNDAFEKVDFSARGNKKDKQLTFSTSADATAPVGVDSAESKRTIIEKLILNLNVDIKDIESLKKLFGLLDEIEDRINSTEEGEPVTA